jgi:ferric-dicitrate binding protein FerR (iron transport regulator)
MESRELKSLVQQYLAGTISRKDFTRLWATLNKPANESDWLAAIEEALQAKSPSGFSEPYQAKLALENIKAKILEEQHATSRSYYFLNNNKRIIRYAAAAIVIISAISAAILIKYSLNKNEFTSENVATVNAVHDVEPGSEKAVLTLSDGSQIVLDNANNGQIAQQGQTKVIKLDNGEIQYQALNNKKSNGQVVAFNTMSTPRGGQYQLVLPDGSKVWLNSESSITYPVAFTHEERKVKITGEAYFEVRSDKGWPFRVECNTTGRADGNGDEVGATKRMVIEVLGTHFNVKAYADDGPAKTSLLEGSVKIENQILKPGQAFMNGRIVRTNIEQDVAWKNGVFNFDNQNLSQVMKQLARWYDLEVVYPDGVPQKEYGGEIGRNLKLNQVLNGLENSGVHFELNGRRVTILLKK